MTKQTSITRQIALQTSYEMGQYAARRGSEFCPLTDLECRLHWTMGFVSIRKAA